MASSIFLVLVFFVLEKYVFASSDLFSVLDETTQLDLFSSTSQENVFSPDSGLSSALDDSAAASPFLISNSEEPILGEKSPILGLNQDVSVAEMLSSCSDDKKEPFGKLRIRNPSCSSAPGASLNIPDLSNLLNQIGEPNDLLDAWQEGTMTTEKAKLKEHIDAYCADTPIFPVPICGPFNSPRPLELPSDPGTFWEPFNNYPLYCIDNARLRKPIHQIWFSRKPLHKFCHNR